MDEIPQVERNYLRFMIETFNSRDISNTFEWVQAQLLTIQLIQFVEKTTAIPFHLKEEATIRKSLQAHRCTDREDQNNMQVINPLKENIRTNYFPFIVWLPNSCP